MNKVDKYKNLKELRELAGLKQSELALLSGITQPYLSEIETDRKPFTKEAAEKISAGFYFILSGPGNPVYIEPEIIRSNHLASRLPIAKQEVANELMAKVAFYGDYLDYILSGKGDNKEEYKLEALNLEENMSYKGHKRSRGPNYIAGKIFNSKKWIDLHKKYILKILEEEKMKARLNYQERAIVRIDKEYNFTKI